MTPDQARATLEQAFATGWGGAVPVLWANDSRPTPDGEFVEFLVAHTGANLNCWTGAAKTYRRLGLAIVKVCVPPGTGAARALQLAYQGISVLEGKRFGVLDCLTGAIRDSGNRADGSGRYVVFATVRFEHTDTRA